MVAVAPEAGLAGAGTAALHVLPREVVQGQACEVQVRVVDPAQVWATAGGRAVLLYRTREGYRGFVGTSPHTPPGALLVRVVVATRGHQVELVGQVRVRAGRFGERHLRVAPELLDPRLAAYERRRVEAATARPLPDPRWAGPFRLPVRGPVVSPYGVRNVYNGRPYGHHLGVDVRAKPGTPVRAAQHGQVVLAERLPLGGNTVILDHGAGVFSSYLHLSALAVRVGQQVRAGQVIGYVGSTGRSTAPHLHWGLRVNGIPVDPLPWTARGRRTPP